jgi:hypothetical protein
MAERVNHQLGHGDALVPLARLQLTLFPYEAPEEVLTNGRHGFLLGPPGGRWQL